MPSTRTSTRCPFWRGVRTCSRRERRCSFRLLYTADGSTHQELSASQRGLVRLQHWLLFPVLFVARVSWCIQSLAFPFTHTLGFSKHAVEVLTLAAHYAWLLTASFSLLPPLKVRAPMSLKVAGRH